MTVIGSDSPVESVEDDLLNGFGVARAIHRTLHAAPPFASTRIGLFGRWGSGKTSVLNLLRRLEEDSGALVVSFSAWSASEESGVISQFYSTLLRRLREEQFRLPFVQRVKRFGGTLKHVGALLGIVGAGAEHVLPFPAVATKAATNALVRLTGAASSWTRIGAKDLAALSESLAGRRVVVFIDDLDRADPKSVPKTLLAMRELLDWPGFTFILAFDRRAIASALYDYSKAFGEDAQGFLEKVIDIPFEMPRINDAQLANLANAAFRECCPIVPAAAIEAIVSLLPAQPRRVKLIARTMGVLSTPLGRHDSQDVDWLGLLLFLIVREASESAAEAVLQIATRDVGEWETWTSNQEERAKRDQVLREELHRILPESERNAVTGRPFDAAIRLINHWSMTPQESIRHWVGTTYKDPDVTAAEVRSLRNFSTQPNVEQALVALVRSRESDGIRALSVAHEVVLLAVAEYQRCLNLAADSMTDTSLVERLEMAGRSLSLIEHLWNRSTDLAIRSARESGSATVALLQVVERWLSWTRNPGEVMFRKREHEVALSALAACNEPELVFESTDPYATFPFAVDASEEVRRSEWRTEIVKVVGPAVASRLVDRFRSLGGLEPIANGEPRLSAWLVESAESPLYKCDRCASRLVQIFRGSDVEDAVSRTAIADNALLYLKQILFQTRDASWGGPDDAKQIHILQPDLIPEAWKASLSVGVPFRMQKARRKLRADLVNVGVDPKLLSGPEWLSS